jgi:hypothetical protein
MIFEHYCFTFGGRKAVQLGDVERITVEPPTYLQNVDFGWVCNLHRPALLSADGFLPVSVVFPSPATMQHY